MKRPDNINESDSDNENRSGTEKGFGTDTGSGTGSGTENAISTRNRMRVIMRFIAFGILCLISIAVMVLVIWINIRSRLN